jgi:hypothetical protein
MRAQGRNSVLRMEAAEWSVYEEMIHWIDYEDLQKGKFWTNFVSQIREWAETTQTRIMQNSVQIYQHSPSLMIVFASFLSQERHSEKGVSETWRH